MIPELSVVICAHNPRVEYLKRVLEALGRQTLAIERWELLLVDNMSNAPLSRTFDLAWHPLARHVREDTLGVAVARQRGIREASGDLIVFVDDDNLLQPTYLENAIKIGADWPQLGVWGGSINPEFEVEPPMNIRRFLRYLALREVTSPLWTNLKSGEAAEPWGAGMCFRAIVGKAYCAHFEQSSLRLPGRVGTKYIAGSGEDTEICYVACSQGLGMGVFPELTVTHLIPKERLTEAYMLRLIEGISISHRLLGFKWLGIMPRSPFHFIEILRHAKNFVVRDTFDRRVYLTSVRATLRARSIILGARNQCTLLGKE
jgi:GT2 family glycosyltransferase